MGQNKGQVVKEVLSNSYGDDFTALSQSHQHFIIRQVLFVLKTLEFDTLATHEECVDEIKETVYIYLEDVVRSRNVAKKLVNLVGSSS